MKMSPWLKKMFIPHEGNNHHPHFWKKNSVALVFSLILLLEVGVFAQSSLFFKDGSYQASVLPTVLAAMTNDERVVNNAQPLTENSLLDQAAKLKAEDMAKRGYFSHNTPEGYLPWYWLDKVGYTYSHAGENLAVNFNDSRDVVDAWMNSPTHRANIVKSVYTETGLGVAEGIYQGRPAVFVAQFFGTPEISITKPTETILVKEATQPIKVASTKVKNNASTSVAGAEVDESKAVIPKTNVINTLATSPRHVGTNLLFILLGFVVAAFLLIIYINGKVHHPKIILLATTMVVVIIGSMVMNTTVLKDKVQIGEVSKEASV